MSFTRKSILGFMTAQPPDPGGYRQPMTCGQKTGLCTGRFAAAPDNFTD